MKGIVQPYDWTYTTEYRGTLLSGGGGARLKVEESEEGIDYSQLKQQEKIHFYDDVILYEDELADNGTALLNVKIVSYAPDLTRYYQTPHTEGDGEWVLYSDEVLLES